MADFIHSCPYCSKEITVQMQSDARIAAICPHCKRTFLLLDYGEKVDILLNPSRCPNCYGDLNYEGHPNIVTCPNCESEFVLSKYGDYLLDAKIYQLGEDGELPFERKGSMARSLVAFCQNLSSNTKKSIVIGAIAILCIITGLYVISKPAPIENTMAYAAMDSIWKEFRDKNPYNIQIEGLKRFDDNSYVAIISEPSVFVSEDDLKDFFNSYNCSFKTLTKSIGIDGWLGDVVVSFNDLKKKDIPKFSKKLSKLLYGTDYKASIMNFDTIPEHVAFSSYDLNYQVSEEELRKWFMEDKESLIEIERGDQEKNLSEILQLNLAKPKLYMSKTPGFIVWVLPLYNCKYEDFRVAARKFSIDSDLIFGAIAASGNIAIIARERCVPVFELPPMRVETLCLLANTTESELAQSYERNNMFAGKLSGGKDFAPIYLSDELWHTEYGSILNVTDQMLKSWSENGMVDYEHFDYPKPVFWTFDKGVTKELGVDELTYNWNTEGVGYIVEDDAFSIYALNRTGSLPVSYIPGQTSGISDSDPVYRAEQYAYDFFSSLSCPELVKVVQYAAMYQIFRNLEFSVNSFDEDDIGAEDAENTFVTLPEEMRDEADKLFTRLVEFDTDVKKSIASHFKSIIISKETFETSYDYDGFKIDESHYIAKKVKNQSDLLDLIQCSFVYCELDTLHEALSLVSGDYELMDGLRSSLIAPDTHIGFIQGLDDSFEKKKSLMKVSQHHVDELMSMNKEQCIDFILSKMSAYSSSIQRLYNITGSFDTQECMDMLLHNNESTCSRWIKCPTVVQSWSLTDSVNIIGGHNLNSKVTRFKVSKTLKPGQTRKVTLNDVEYIEVSAYDRSAHIANSNYLRQVGRLGKSEIKGSQVPLRQRSFVLNETSARSARGFNTADHLKIRLNQTRGHMINGKKYESLDELLNDASELLEKGNVKFKQIEIEGLESAGVDVDVFIDGVAGRMKRGAGTNIPMSSYDFAHKTVSIQGDKAIVTIPIKAGTIDFGSTSGVTRAGLGGSSAIKPTMTIKSGEVIFKVPKNKLQEFIKLIEEFIARQKGYWNEYKIKLEMKRRGINPFDCEERTKLRIAKNKSLQWLEQMEAEQQCFV